MLHVFVQPLWRGLDELLDQVDTLTVRSTTQGNKAATLYIRALSQLRAFPHPATEAMIESLCEIVYHNLVFVSLTRPSATLQIRVTSVEGVFEQAVIRLPLNWLDLFQEDPIFQLGSVLYTGSQAVDFYNGRLSQDAVRSCNLAQAHEAELLKFVAREMPEYGLDAYQLRVLEKYPQGLDTPGAKELLYPLAPVEVIEA